MKQAGILFQFITTAILILKVRSSPTQDTSGKFIYTFSLN